MAICCSVNCQKPSRSRVSSSIFSAELHPDLRLRRAVLLSGAGFAGIGVLVIVSMRLHPLALVAASGCWLVVCSWEWRRILCGFSECQRLRFMADGAVMLLDPNGHWHPARLLPGSVLLRHAGWLLLEAGRGRRFAEPVRGRCRQSNDWRRLQVIWRHVGATG